MLNKRAYLKSFIKIPIYRCVVSTYYAVVVMEVRRTTVGPS